LNLGDLLTDLGDLLHELRILRSIDHFDVLGGFRDLLLDLRDLLFKKLTHGDGLQPRI
jgi:hypothetical protein